MRDRTFALLERILAVICFILSAGSQAVLEHDLAALFFSILFLLVGVYEFWLGTIGRIQPSYLAMPDPPAEPPPPERRRASRRSAAAAAGATTADSVTSI